VSQKQKNPSKGRRVALRTEAETPPCPTMVMVATEAEESTTRLSLTLKIPGFGRFKMDSARTIRRRPR
jgi:hypothetical protein